MGVTGSNAANPRKHLLSAEMKGTWERKQATSHGKLNKQTIITNKAPTLRAGGCGCKTLPGPVRGPGTHSSTFCFLKTSSGKICRPSEFERKHSVLPSTNGFPRPGEKRPPKKSSNRTAQRKRKTYRRPPQASTEGPLTQARKTQNTTGSWKKSTQNRDRSVEKTSSPEPVQLKDTYQGDHLEVAVGGTNGPKEITKTEPPLIQLEGG